MNEEDQARPNYNKVQKVEVQTIEDGTTQEPLIDELNRDTSHIPVEQLPNILGVCKNGNLDMLKVLVARGVSVKEKNAFGATCLLIACEYGQLEIMKYLLANGSDVHEKDDGGYTNLLIACYKGYLDIFKFLVENGCDVHEKSNDGDSCIALASSKGHLEIIKYLVIEKGCSLQDMDMEGTCIMNAARNDYYECVLWMLSNGSSLDENTRLDENGNIKECESCENILKQKGMFYELKKIFETKSSK